MKNEQTEEDLLENITLRGDKTVEERVAWIEQRLDIGPGKVCVIPYIFAQIKDLEENIRHLRMALGKSGPRVIKMGNEECLYYPEEAVPARACEDASAEKIYDPNATLRVGLLLDDALGEIALLKKENSELKQELQRVSELLEGLQRK